MRSMVSKILWYCAIPVLSGFCSGLVPTFLQSIRLLLVIINYREIRRPYKMGALECCFGSVDDVETPDPEIKRQQMLQAAVERRNKEEARGVKNPEKVKQQMRKAEEKEVHTNQATDGGLRWQVG
ncbi:uncharacterized protein LOC143460120 isoform X1 [Clavelina lepadiformis]|uniref:uncharacterized protein LOC143460120 isoform X1 n=2 Tax=Clavelina lepadiformis TaxID=159417 RepID=UPI0040420640